jgi:FSR family fosmidomycin resistance protein-like MFS transporter
MIKIASGSQTGKGMSFFMVGGESARTIGPLIVTGAISGFEGIYRLIPIGLLASLFLWYKLKDFQVEEFSSKKIEKGGTKEILKKLYSFFAILGSYMLFNAGTKSAVTLYLPVYLTRHGFSIYEAGISLSVLQFFGIAGTFFSGRFSDKIGRRNMLLVSALGTTLSMILFLYFNSFALFPILAVLGFFLFTPNPVMMAAVQDTNSSKPTFVNSIYMGINFGISSLVVFLVGFFADIYGLERVYEICTVFTFLSIFIILFLPVNKES